MAIAAGSFAGRFLAAVSRRAPAFQGPPVQRPIMPTVRRIPRKEAGTGVEDELRRRLEVLDLVLDRLLPDAERLRNRDALHWLAQELQGIRAFLQSDVRPLVMRNPRLGGAAQHAAATYQARLAGAALLERIVVLGRHEMVKSRWRDHAAVGEALEDLFNWVYIQTPPIALSVEGSRYVGATARLAEARRRLILFEKALDEEVRLLLHAADDFTDADLTDVDPAAVDLAWLHWDTSTRWPPRWAEQIRRMSLQTAPGQFVVQPVDADDRAEWLADV